jgi:uncharacterized protein YfiM (DUF2279 family)
MLRLLFVFLLLVCLSAAGLAAGLFLALEDRASLARTPPPSGRDVAAARALSHAVRDAADTGAPVILTESQLDGVMRVGADVFGNLPLAARIVPELRVDAAIENGTVILRAAAGLATPGRGRWLNVEVIAPPFDDGFALDALRIGPFSPPPGLFVEAGRVLANLVLGGSLGDALLGSAEAMTVEDDAVRIAMRLTEEDRGDILRGVFGVLGGGALPDPEAVTTIHERLLDALVSRRAPPRGDLTPLVILALESAREEIDADGPGERAAAAAFALAKTCSPRAYATLVSKFTGDDAAHSDRDDAACSSVTLAGRTDSRQHFVVSAALRAASNQGVSLRIGEYKELNDSLAGGSGFDFSDLAANRAGERLADRMSAAPLSEWPALIARINSEAAFMPSLDALPPRMSEREFAGAFGAVDSAEYEDVIAEINDRIDALPLYR